MKRKTQLFLESMNSYLNEKINKDNIEINKAIANPNLGKNKEKIKAAGYDLEQTDDGKVYAINNPKTKRWIDPSQYNKDEKGKVDFKGQLDTERPRTNTTIRDKEYVDTEKIPKSLKVGKDKIGRGIYNRDDIDSYSPNYRDEKKKSISTNINDYNKAVKTRDEEKGYADRGRKSLDYYEKKVKDAQHDLDMQNKYIANADKKSSDAEAQRKVIIDKIRNRKTNESALTEDSYEQYQSVMNAIDNAISNIDNNEDIQELLQNIIGICRDIAEDRDLMVESNLTEAGLANLKTMDDFSDIDEFHDALEDDKNTISNSLENLKPKMNLKGSVDFINSIVSQVEEQITSYNN